MVDINVVAAPVDWTRGPRRRHMEGEGSKGILLKLDRGFRKLLANEQALIAAETGVKPPRTNLMRDLMRAELSRRAEARGESIPHAEPATFDDEPDDGETTQVGHHVTPKAPPLAQDARKAVPGRPGGQNAPEALSGAPSAPAQVLPVAVGRAAGQGGYVGDIKLVGVGARAETKGAADGE